MKEREPLGASFWAVLLRNVGLEEGAMRHEAGRSSPSLHRNVGTASDQCPRVLCGATACPGSLCVVGDQAQSRPRLQRQTGSLGHDVEPS